MVDCALGTPPLLVGGILAWVRRPLGYAVAAGLLFVSGLGGLAFAAAALLDSLLSGGPIELAVVAVHVLISAVSFGLLAWFWRSRDLTPRESDPVPRTQRSRQGRDVQQRSEGSDGA